MAIHSFLAAAHVVGNGSWDGLGLSCCAQAESSSVSVQNHQLEFLKGCMVHSGELLEAVEGQMNASVSVQPAEVADS